MQELVRKAPAKSRRRAWYTEVPGDMTCKPTITAAILSRETTIPFSSPRPYFNAPI